MAKSEVTVVEVTIGHTAGGSVDIRDYGKEKSTYSYHESHKLSFGEGWTDGEIAEAVEERRADLREKVDAIAQVEHEERFAQSYLSGKK